MANQPFFKYIKRKITPAEIQKNNAEKWLVCTASSAGGRGRFTHFLRKWFVHCSIFAAKWNFPILQTERASDRRRRGWRFCWSGGGSALQGTAQKQVFCFPIFPVSQATRNNQFLIPRFTLGA